MLSAMFSNLQDEVCTHILSELLIVCIFEVTVNSVICIISQFLNYLLVVYNCILSFRIQILYSENLLNLLLKMPFEISSHHIICKEIGFFLISQKYTFLQKNIFCLNFQAKILLLTLNKNMVDSFF